MSNTLVSRTYRGGNDDSLVAICDPHPENEEAARAAMGYHAALKQTRHWGILVVNPTDWAEVNLVMGLCPFCGTSISKVMKPSHREVACHSST